jgi:hypothetical protein
VRCLDMPGWARLCRRKYWTGVCLAFGLASSGLAQVQPSTFLYPPNGAVDVDPSKPFAWTSVPGAQAYRLLVGQTPGGADFIDTGATTQTSRSMGSLPAGQVVFARLMTYSNLNWLSSDVVFMIGGASSPLVSRFTYPTAGAVGADPRRPFSWTAVAGAQAYRLQVGLTPGGAELLDTGEIDATSYTIGGLPADRTIYARIWTRTSGAWLYTEISLSVIAVSLPPRQRMSAPTLPTRPSIRAPFLVPAAHGDWRQWRGDREHTGFQSQAGRIEAPGVLWRFPIGGRLQPSQASPCTSPGAEPFLLISPPGSLASYSLDGRLLWQRRNASSLNLLGCWDLGRDGRTTVVASSSTLSGTALYLFDGRNGDFLWATPVARGGVGSLKLAPLHTGGDLFLFWLPAASSTVFAYRFAPGWIAPTLAWSATLQNFLSDPYTPSALAIADVSGDGQPEIVISGARGSVPTITLDPNSGLEVSRSYVMVDGHGVESGGARQLLKVAALDPPGPPEVVTISSYNSGENYMFQGITVTHVGAPQPKAVLDTFPFGLRYADDSIRDFDGDGRPDILVSRYVVEAQRHDLLLLDGSTLAVKASLPNFYLLSVVDLGGTAPLILGWVDVASEIPLGSQRLAACRYENAQFQPTGWSPGVGALGIVPGRAYDRATTENPGSYSVVFPQTDRSGPQILLYGQGRPGLVLTDALTGSVVGRYDAPTGVSIALLAAWDSSDPDRRAFVVSGDDGSLVFLDGSLKVVADELVGGYYQASALNGHSFEVAAVADLDGRGRNDIVVLDSGNRVLRLTGVTGATPLNGPGGSVLFDSGASQELLAVRSPAGAARLAVRGWSGSRPYLRLVDGLGHIVWEHVFAGPGGGPAEVGLPSGLNVLGPENQDGQLVLSMDSGSGAWRTLALDATSGATLWDSGIGTYWDATLAVGDVDGDDYGDVVFNDNVFKGFALDGRTGLQRADSAVLPAFQDLGNVDYNGALVVVGRGSDGLKFLDAGDDAHLALLVAPTPSPIGPPPQTRVLWDLPQAAPDDERLSMPAVAPMGREGWVTGVGSGRGVLKGVDRDGRVLWQVGLWSGAEVPDSSVPPNSLSSVTAIDVNADGRVEFLVGGTDGWLYAVDSSTGSLVWSMDLGAPVGDPIAADINGDGWSELLVPVGDGYLYALGPK